MGGLAFVCLFLVFVGFFILVALAGPVNTSALRCSATWVLQSLEIFAASPLMISHKIKVRSKQTLEI